MKDAQQHPQDPQGPQDPQDPNLSQAGEAAGETAGPTPDRASDVAPDGTAGRAARGESSSALFGGVYGTVLASALLAALQNDHAPFTPVYDAMWVLVTAVTAALAHGYAHHMSTRPAGSAGHRWGALAHRLIDEWPLVVASLPTVALLLVAGAAGWAPSPVAVSGLALNATLLFGWGVVAALRMGYRRRGAVLIGMADCTLGLLIAVANAMIK